MRDLIERQAAIDLAQELIVPNEYKYGLYNQAINNYCVEIMQLPSAEQKIIHCEDCRHRDPEDKKCDCGHDILWQMPRNDKWFCADAERKTDGVQNE